MSSPLFKKLDAASDRAGEYRDCTVKAWAIAADLPYEEAHEDLRRVGRKRRRGVFFTSVLPALCSKRSKRLTNVTNKYKAKTAVTIARELPKRGIFVITFRGHVAVFRGGEMHDWTAGRRHRVLEIFRVNSDSAATPVVFNRELGLSVCPMTGGVIRTPKV